MTDQTFTIREIDTTNPSQAKAFLGLPFHLYRDVPQWVPPLHSEAKRMLDRRRNPFFKHSEAAFWIAYQDDRVVGRLAALDHHSYNSFNKERTAFFYLYECENIPDAARLLFESAFGWARKRGLERIIGPKGFSPLDGMGLLVDGFEHRPALGIPYNLPYYSEMLEALGFSNSGEIVSCYLNASIQFPHRIHEIAQMVQERRGLRIARFHRRKDLRQIVPRLKALYNMTIEGTSGNYPVSDEDVQAIADQMLRFADPRLIKIIMKDDDVVGFLFAYPDISAAMQRVGGRLFPFGWAYLLRDMKHTPWVNINGMGVVKQYRGLGGTALLFSEMQKSIIECGFQHADLVQIGSENAPMLRELRSLGIDVYKKHCLYTRELSK